MQKWGQISDAFIHEIFINCQLKTRKHATGERTRFRGVRNVALDTQWLESLVGAWRQHTRSHMMDGWMGERDGY